MTEQRDKQAEKEAASAVAETSSDDAETKAKPAKKLKEIGGPKGPEPTRYGDWERKGRCIDF